MTYQFKIGDKLVVRSSRRYVIVTSCVPRDGIVPYYFVEFDDTVEPSEDLFSEDELEPR